jgi:site-specific recombinase XerD
MKTKTSDFMTLLQAFFDQHLPVAVGASANTVNSYKHAFRLLLSYLHSVRQVAADQVSFQMLNYECLSGFLDWLEQERNCSVSTKNQRLSALLSFSKYAQNRNFEAASVFRSSVTRIPLKKSTQKLRVSFTVPEVKLLLQAPNESKRNGKRDKTLLSLMYASGARAQEICNLKVKDIFFQDSGVATIILTGKGGKVRKIGIPASCATILERYILSKGIEAKPQRHIFSSQTHEMMTVSCIEEIFKKHVSACREAHPHLFPAGSYPPHAMRHTTACHMLEAGIPLIVIKNFLGHVSIATTQVYAEVSQDLANRHLKTWSERWFGATPSEDATDSEKRENAIPDFLQT